MHYRVQCTCLPQPLKRPGVRLYILTNSYPDSFFCFIELSRHTLFGICVHPPLTTVSTPIVVTKALLKHCSPVPNIHQYVSPRHDDDVPIDAPSVYCSPSCCTAPLHETNAYNMQTPWRQDSTQTAFSSSRMECRETCA